MRFAAIIARVLLGLTFLVFGLNHLLHFLPQPSAPPGDAAMYGKLLSSHHVMTFVGWLMAIAGLLLLVGRWVPLALVILGPILVNILMFHILFNRPGLLRAVALTALEVLLIVAYRTSFRPLFQARSQLA